MLQTIHKSLRLGRILWQSGSEQGQMEGSCDRKGKGKANPLQAWTGPEGSRRLRLPDFKSFST